MTRSNSVPSIIIGVAAFLSFVLSVTLWFTGNRDEGMFVGLWVPSILAAGAFVLVSLDRIARKG
ncbi:MAG: hypothetical protein JHC84_13875 [Solirubrobacteraceae bacterium]|nr:hypothetical protein [Solirubrobacteraceae bacterium]